MDIVLQTFIDSVQINNAFDNVSSYININETNSLLNLLDYIAYDYIRDVPWFFSIFIYDKLRFTLTHNYILSLQVLIISICVCIVIGVHIILTRMTGTIVSLDSSKLINMLSTRRQDLHDMEQRGDGVLPN